MDSLTSILVIKALDGLSARAVATAHNIANAQSPGFRPLRVTFEDALARAAAQGPEQARQVAPRQVEASRADEEVRLDQEMADSAATALRYGALIEVLNRRMQISSLIVTGR